MQDIRSNFSAGLDLDTDKYSTPENAYVEALNVTRDSDNKDGAMASVLGNTQVAFSGFALKSGTNKVIGSCVHPVRNLAYYFLYNSNDFHAILEYDRSAGVVRKVFENKTDSNSVDILGFEVDKVITSVNIITRDDGDFLFFLDTEGRPTVMNIQSMILGIYTPVTRDIIDVHKCPPLFSPIGVYGNDATVNSNSLRNKLFRFRQRWVYDDDEKSTCSPISEVPLPLNPLDDDYNAVISNNNKINITLNTGDKSVKSIELLVSYCDRTSTWSDFALVTTLSKSDLGITDNSFYSYSFFNDGAYVELDPNEVLLMFDWIPDRAGAQELLNGNVLSFAECEEGLDRTFTPDCEVTVGTIPVDTEGTGTLTSSLLAPEFYSTHTAQWAIFTGTPLPGTAVVIKAKRRDNGQIVTISSWTCLDSNLDSLVAGLASNVTQPYVAIAETESPGKIKFNLMNPFPSPLSFYMELDAEANHLQVVITSPSSNGVTSLPTWKFLSQRRIGREYFNSKGKSNGVLHDVQLSFPSWTEGAGGSHINVPYIHAEVSDQPPIWAHSFQWVITKDETYYLDWYVLEVDDSEEDYLYYKIVSFSESAKKRPTTEKVLSYTFQEGDRMRLIKRVSTHTLYSSSFDGAIEGLMTDPKINDVEKDGQYLKVKKTGPLSTLTYDEGGYQIEIYRPVQNGGDPKTRVYFEFGAEYAILDPGTSNRRHAGDINQVLGSSPSPAEYNFYNGDCYLRVRTVDYDTGTARFYAQDKNFVDNYLSAVSSVDGRPTVFDESLKPVKLPYVRFSQAYQEGTSINGLNRFYPNNYEPYDQSFGEAKRLKVRERSLRIFQELKVGVMNLFSQIVKSPSGGEVSVVTDKLLNPIQYYVGDFGIGNSPESLASNGFADYFCDTNNGVVCRVSSDGVTPISILYKVNSLMSTKLPLRGGTYKVFGGFDVKNRQYIIAMEQANTDPAYTISFSEGGNEVRPSFESELSYHPEGLCCLGNLLISFKNGRLYTHDNSSHCNFYGTQYECYVVFNFNKFPLQKKTWMAVAQSASHIWDSPMIETNLISHTTVKQESNLIAADYETREGMFHAAFLRDKNSLGGIANGSALKGNYILVKFRRQNAGNGVSLSIVSVRFVDSPLTTK